MHAQAERKLLTIAIPTYNRANDLKLCLSQIVKNLKRMEQFVEIIVSDNHSTDNTYNIVNEYISKGINIKYVKNTENIGPDRNFIQCFNMATGNYVWAMGDDDVILDGYLSKIIELLKKNVYGTIHLRTYSYQYDFYAERPRQGEHFNCMTFDDSREFIKKTGHMLTFSSANIVNKDLVEKDINLDAFDGTNLPHLVWIFSAMFNSKKNLLIDEFIVAGKPAISGYALCKVFGTNINKLFAFFVNRGVNKENFDIINRSLAKYFFPKYIYLSRKKDIIYTGEGDYYEVLHPILKSYANFWIFTVPAIKLPLSVIRLAYFVKEMICKVKGR